MKQDKLNLVKPTDHSMIKLNMEEIEEMENKEDLELPIRAFEENKELLVADPVLEHDFLKYLCKIFINKPDLAEKLVDLVQSGGSFCKKFFTYGFFLDLDREEQDARIDTYVNFLYNNDAYSEKRQREASKTFISLIKLNNNKIPPIPEKASFDVLEEILITYWIEKRLHEEDRKNLKCVAKLGVHHLRLPEYYAFLKETQGEEVEIPTTIKAKSRGFKMKTENTKFGEKKVYFNFNSCELGNKNYKIMASITDNNDKLIAYALIHSYVHYKPTIHIFTIKSNLLPSKIREDVEKALLHFASNFTKEDKFSYKWDGFEKETYELLRKFIK